jgi:aspartate kinase
MQVFKFGGASVKDAPSVRNVLSILNKFAKNHQTLMVISAMGKTTNLLEELTEAYFKKNHYLKEEKYKAFLKYHQSIRKELELNESEEWLAFLDEFEWELNSPPALSFDYHYDQIVSKGELASSIIVSDFFRQIEFRHTWIDARDIILTDDNYREANVDFEKSQLRAIEKCTPLLQHSGLILTQGFIGSTNENNSTTLGREGSDYTAALFSFFLDAEKMIVWKDVPGILNADPRFFKNPVLMDEISYYDAIEMTYYGATVIHPKTIRPLQNKKIPLWVKSFLNPDSHGTKISEDFSDKTKRLPTFIYKPHQILISVQTKDFSFISEGYLSKFFTIAQKHKIKIHLMQNSALNFSICTDYVEDKIQAFINELSGNFKVYFNTGVGLLTIRSRDESVKFEDIFRNKKILLVQKTRNTAQYVLDEA